jgi:hypothetical protein
MKLIDGYRHEVASHCESGSVRNLLRHAGLEATEPMVFGVGSGALFYYLFFVKGLNGWPLLGIRNTPGQIAANIRRLCGVDLELKTYPSSREGMAAADRLLDAGTPVAAVVDMFYMKYLPTFLRHHAPLHFIVLLGHDERSYAVSDPYFENVATLERADLAAAWETHAPLARNNLLLHVRSVPPAVDWRRAARRAIRRTCKAMVLPPVVRKVFFFVGVQGMRKFAREMVRWPDHSRGATLREGMLFNALGFEDQGTGGAAFRLMYGAFLREVAELFGSSELRELSRRMIVHGREWRAASRQLIVLAKQIPMPEEEYAGWYAANEQPLRDGLAELSRKWLAFADTEQAFYVDLRRVVERLEGSAAAAPGAGG